MRRLFLTLILCAAAFVAGIVAERGKQAEACDAAGGTWSAAGFCAEADQ